MPRDEPPKRKISPETKAQNLLRRFPVIDLAKAVSLPGTRRNAFLVEFVTRSTTRSLQPTRDACSMIYAAQGPLIESAPEAWKGIETHLKGTARSDILADNLAASRELFDFIRPIGYVATQCEAQVLRVRLKQIVNIELKFYLTLDERLIFQFPLVRKECLEDSALRVLGSIVYHAYVRGDFSLAEIEVADISCLPGGNRRCPRIRPVPRGEILSRETLNEQIVEVYATLADIALRPRQPPEDTTPLGF